MKRTLPLIPALLFVVWLSAVGAMVWRKAHLTLFPPSPDPMSYIQKAVHFWDNAKKGFPVNPLNLAQPIRPPGTVLISYPFGYDGDHAAFFFRTAYIPFLIWTAAVLLLFWPTGQSGDRRSGMTNAFLAAMLFGASPFLLHLEYGGGQTAWGFMDQALGAVAGFAMAAVFRGVSTRSPALLFTGVGMACFALLLKPTGGLVLLFCGSFLVVAELLRAWGHEVVAVYDGEAALRAADGDPPALVLMDIAMPGLDGYATVHRLRAMHPGAGMKVVALTGFGQPADVRRARDRRCDVDGWHVRPRHCLTNSTT